MQAGVLHAPRVPPPPNTSGGILSTKDDGFGGGAWGRYLVLKVEASWMGVAPGQRGPRGFPSPFHHDRMRGEGGRCEPGGGFSLLLVGTLHFLPPAPGERAVSRVPGPLWPWRFAAVAPWVNGQRPGKGLLGQGAQLSSSGTGLVCENHEALSPVFSADGVRFAGVWPKGWLQKASRSSELHLEELPV